MVKALHGVGIEIILDVVYNHTNEASLVMDWCHFDQVDSYMLVRKYGFNFMAICHQTITICSLVCSVTILIACWKLWIKHRLDGICLSLFSHGTMISRVQVSCHFHMIKNAYFLVSDHLSAHSFVWLTENQGYMAWMLVMLHALHVIIRWMN